MPVSVSDVDALRTYLRGVLGKAKHHARNVDQIVLALAGAVISRLGSQPLEVRKGSKSRMALTLTFTSAKKRRYCLSYNHAEEQIELRKGSYKGQTLHAFTNDTPIAEVAEIFANV